MDFSCQFIYPQRHLNESELAPGVSYRLLKKDSVMERIIGRLANLTPVSAVPSSPWSCRKERLPEPEGESRQFFGDDVAEYDQTPNATSDQELRVDSAKGNHVQMFMLAHTVRYSDMQEHHPSAHTAAAANDVFAIAKRQDRGVSD